MSGYQKCTTCGSMVPVQETVPPSGFVDWVPIDGASLDAAIAEWRAGEINAETAMRIVRNVSARRAANSQPRSEA